MEVVTFGFNSIFEYMNPDSLNFKANPKAWSIGEILEHIILVNESYYPIFEKVRDREFDPPFLSRFEFLVDLYGRMILKSVEPERKKKVKTLRIWKPSQSYIPFKIMDRFFSSQMELNKYLESVESFAEEELVIHSPANKNVVYQLDVAFDIIVAHEQRHLNQAKEVLESLKAQLKD